MKKRTKLILGGAAAGTVMAGAAAGLGAVLAARYALKTFRGYRLRGLRGQTVLITGGSRGLGLAMAEEFAQFGAKVAICARDEQELARARQQLEDQGAVVCAVPCDVSKPEEVDNLISSVSRHMGKIDVLVNNAGVISVGPILSQELKDFQEAMDVMFWGTVHPTLAVLPQMLSRGKGRIVNISSIGGKVSIPHLIPYGCAKFAATGFSEGLHAELKRFGIHVLTVIPGLMRTGSHLNAQFKGNHEAEFGWFAVSGTNPLASVSARRAAQKIVNATCANRTELTISWQAKTLATVHGVAPSLTQEVLAQVNRLLPDAAGVTEKKAGHESQSAVTRSPLTVLGKRAARRYNQVEKPAKTGTGQPG
ncbi:MAG TPA: SDR family NAD(P)-dependent oxidoreductase [Candidatus Angelobacter sp.]|nr:SDR family NAD(P)-dependent oxidoreductase [Candidatus Angelobacter sp.]